jgi:hypothetical protein
MPDAPAHPANDAPPRTVLLDRGSPPAGQVVARSNAASPAAAAGSGMASPAMAQPPVERSPQDRVEAERARRATVAVPALRRAGSVAPPASGPAVTPGAAPLVAPPSIPTHTSQPLGSVWGYAAIGLGLGLVLLAAVLFFGCAA